MEIKKSPKADLQNKRGLLLEIGLIIALGGVIAAFAWTPKEQKIEKLDLNIAPVEEEIMEITRQEQKPPESPKKTEITVITDILKATDAPSRRRAARPAVRPAQANTTRRRGGHAPDARDARAAIPRRRDTSCV